MSNNTISRRPRVQLMQLNNGYDNQYFLPYSVGVLISFVQQFDEITEHFEFAAPIHRRERAEAIVDKIGNVDVFGASCYVWNWRLSVEVAAELRRRSPDALILLGGPHVADVDPEFFDRYPFIDIAVHGEGEHVLQEILNARIAGGGYEAIASTSYHDRQSGRVTHNEKRPRMRSLAGLPSPYLSGVFDPLVESSEGVEWMATWETNRGCPFQCTFCDWGSAISSRVLEFDWDRLLQEVGWFSERKIRFVFGADANFGIRKRDREIAEVLVAAKRRHGYPQDFRVCFTKNSTQKIFDVASIFHDGGMLKGVSLSMQSVNEETLTAIKRRNIKLDVFQELQARYNEAQMSTYTELIIGLPGETYDSFIDGIDRLLESGQHSQIIIYNCTVMPNAEMGHPDYRALHQIKTVEIPIFTAHASPPDPSDPVVEYEPIIIQTKRMSVDDWRRMYHFAWAVQCFHTLGLLQEVAIFLRNHLAVRYRDFYESLIEWGKARPDGLIGGEIAAVDGVLDRVLAGVGFDQYLPEFLDITWPAEEASLLRFSKVREELYDEFTHFVSAFISERGLDVDGDLLHDLMMFQKFISVNPNDDGDLSLTLSANIPDYVAECRRGREAVLLRTPVSYRIVRGRGFRGDQGEYARTVVWYGRKGGKFRYPVERAA